VVICPERGVDLHTAQLIPLLLTVSCFSKIQIGFTFLVPAHLGATENASTENESTGGWNMQVRKTQVRICNGGKRKYSNLEYFEEFTIFHSYSCIFSRSAVSSLGLDQFTCTVPDRCYIQEIGIMLDSCARSRAWVHKSQARRCRVTVLGKLFTPIVPLFIKQRNW